MFYYSYAAILNALTHLFIRYAILFSTFLCIFPFIRCCCNVKKVYTLFLWLLFSNFENRNLSNDSYVFVSVCVNFVTLLIFTANGSR